MPSLDAATQEAFAHKALGDVSAMQSVMLAVLGSVSSKTWVGWRTEPS